MVEEIVGTIAGAVTVIGGGVTGGGWLLRRRKKRHAALADSVSPPVTAEPRYPVRFTAWAEMEFHPNAGYREGLAFEVYNQSDHPVKLKGFGLSMDLLTAGNPWTDRKLASAHPPLSFPIRLEPHDAVTGYVDTEQLIDWAYSEGHEHVGSKPYVDIAGYGLSTTDVLNEQPKAET